MIRVVVRAGGRLCQHQRRGSGPRASTKQPPSGCSNSFHSTKSDGMGMGLNICRSIIESHRGRLWVVNNVESDGHITGATFHCSLPIGEPDGPSNGGSEAPEHANKPLRESYEQSSHHSGNCLCRRRRRGRARFAALAAGGATATALRCFSSAETVYSTLWQPHQHPGQICLPDSRCADVRHERTRNCRNA